MKMELIHRRKSSKKFSMLLIVFLLIAFFIQLASPGSYLHHAGENFVQWGVEKAVSAATKELQKRARFE
jgi:hypothetical protein